MALPFQPGAFLQREPDRNENIPAEEINQCLAILARLQLERDWEFIMLGQSYSKLKRLFLGPFE